jgi:hypothetical protein
MTCFFASLRAYGTCAGSELLFGAAYVAKMAVPMTERFVSGDFAVDSEK